MFDLGNLGNFFQTSFLEYHDSLCMNFFGFSFMVSGVFPSTSPTNHLSTLPALVRSSGWGQHGPRASRFGSQRLGPGSAPRWSPRGQPSRSGTKGTEKWHEIFHGEWMGLLPQNGSPTKDDWPEVIPMRSRQRINPKNGHFYDGFCGI